MAESARTTEEFAVSLGVDKQTAYGFIKFLEASGLVEKVGTRPNATGKGKGSNLYTVKPDAGDKLKVILKKVST